MEQPMLLPEAAVSKENQGFSFFGVLALAVSLAVLMLNPSEPIFISCLLTIFSAFLLALMTEEDAHNQTIDLFLLILLVSLFALLSAFQNRFDDFFCDSLIGLFLFSFLRLFLSVFITWREEYVVLGFIDDSDSFNKDFSISATGYVPIFMLVFSLYAGFGTDLAAPVFYESAFLVSAFSDLFTYFPMVKFGVCVIYAMLFGWVLLRSYKDEFVAWAFGGGDVLFLGLFSGFLGLSVLLALFFLSLVMQVALAGLQWLWESNFSLYKS